jgi:uncharacterized protein
VTIRLADDPGGDDMANIDERTGLESLSEEACWERLRAAQVARLAVVVGTQPDIFPVNYLVEDQTLLVRTSPGTKLAAAVLNGRVAVEIDEVDPLDRSGWSVVVHGSAAEIERLPELLAAEDTGLEPFARAVKNRWLRITPDVVTGRRLPGEGAGGP